MINIDAIGRCLGVVVTWLHAGEASPPPGRERVTLKAARALLVDDSVFATSSTRARLWSGLEQYLARFAKLEFEYEAELGGRSLVPYVWLAGSFVSNKLDPSNIDMTVAVDELARRAVQGRRGAAWLRDAFQRAKCLEDFGLSPLEMRYLPVASVFRSDRLDAAEQRYLRERGAWDDWWQRCRPPGVDTASPTLESAVAVRGYLEVTL